MTSTTTRCRRYRAGGGPRGAAGKLQARDAVRRAVAELGTPWADDAKPPSADRMREGVQRIGSREPQHEAEDSPGGMPWGSCWAGREPRRRRCFAPRVQARGGWRLRRSGRSANRPARTSLHRGRRPHPTDLRLPVCNRDSAFRPGYCGAASPTGREAFRAPRRSWPYGCRQRYDLPWQGRLLSPCHTIPTKGGSRWSMFAWATQAFRCPASASAA